jgi:hypothetical protein
VQVGVLAYALENRAPEWAKLSRFGVEAVVRFKELGEEE